MRRYQRSRRTQEIADAITFATCVSLRFGCLRCTLTDRQTHTVHYSKSAAIVWRQSTEKRRCKHAVRGLIRNQNVTYISYRKVNFISSFSARHTFKFSARQKRLICSHTSHNALYEQVINLITRVVAYPGFCQAGQILSVPLRGTPSRSSFLLFPFSFFSLPPFLSVRVLPSPAK